MKAIAAWTVLSIASLIAAAVVLRRAYEASHDDDGFDALIAPLAGQGNRYIESMGEASG